MSTASINNGQFFFSIDTPSYMVFGLSAGVQNANFNWRPPAQRLGQVTKKFNFFFIQASLFRIGQEGVPVVSNRFPKSIYLLPYLSPAHSELISCFTIFNA